MHGVFVDNGWVNCVHWMQNMDSLAVMQHRCDRIVVNTEGLNSIDASRLDVNGHVYDMLRYLSIEIYWNKQRFETKFCQLHDQNDVVGCLRFCFGCVFD
ncbi:hypothetical protein [Candidatus Hodgkinia cicadicola]|uniref:hypothetical protein n=1 Tax=Candidatus Hodgkinia cicadicola TaxID=573658 RepID=UPI001788C9A4